MTNRWLGVVPALAVAIVIAGCGGTPGASKPNQQPASKSDEPVKTSGFDSLGPVTLRVVSSEGSGGPREAIKTLTKQFEAKYPNVTVKVSFRDFSSWIKQAKLVASSDSAPDVFAGNQGYQLDGELVKAGLVLPLDKYAKATAGTSPTRPRPCSSSSGPTTARRSAAARCGASPRPGSRSASSPTRRSSPRRESTPRR